MTILTSNQSLIASTHPLPLPSITVDWDALEVIEGLFVDTGLVRITMEWNGREDWVVWAWRN